MEALRVIRAPLVALSLIFLVSCATTGRGEFCDISKPIRLSHEVIDAMSDAEVAAVLAHNRKGAAMCGWKP